MPLQKISGPQPPPPGYAISLTFNPELFRIIAYVALIIILATGWYLTKYYVHVEPTSTAIYHMFGFNHACNWIDHEPSRTVSAMLLPFWEIPYLLYVFFNFLRINDAYREGKTPKYVFVVSTMLLPIKLLFTASFRIVFVWSPEVSFLMHYLPYIGFQILLCMTAVENVLYFNSVGSLPFNNNRFLAVGYLVLLFAVTVATIGLGLSAALGVINIAGDPVLRMVTETIARTYTILAIPTPLILSVLEYKKSPKHTLTFA